MKTWLLAGLCIAVSGTAVAVEPPRSIDGPRLEAAKDIPGLIDPVSRPTPTALMQTQTFNDFKCRSSGVQVGSQNPGARTGKPSLVMTFPASVQYGEIFAVDTQMIEENPASYSQGGGVVMTVQSVYDFSFHYPLPVNAGFVSVGVSGGNWNSAWGSAPIVTVPPVYDLVAAQGTPAGVPGGTSITFPHISLQALAHGNAGTTIDLTLPGSASFDSPTYHYLQRARITGIGNDLVLNELCNPTQAGHVLIASIPVVAMQTTTTLAGPGGSVVAGASFSLTAHVSSSIATVNDGQVSFERVGAGTIGTVNVSSGSATLSVTAPQAAGSYTYKARYIPSDGNIAASDANASVTFVAAAPSSLAVVSGDAQTVPSGQSFAPLRVRAVDAFGNPVGSLAVNYAAPTTGASAVLSPSSTTTGSDGTAQVSAVANGIAGSYIVTASAGSRSATFHLTNQVSLSIASTPAFPSVRVGESTTVSVAVQGAGLSSPVHLSAALPAGVTGVWSANDVTPPATPTLTLTAATDAPLGVQTLSLSAASGSASASQHGSVYVHDVTPGQGVISIDFVGQETPMQAAEVAGVVARPNWAPAMGNEGVMMGLLDETGTSTSVGLDWSSNGTWQLQDVVDAPGSVRMMKGYLDAQGSGETTIAIRDLPANADGYDVIIYADGDNTTNTRSGLYKIIDDVDAMQNAVIEDLPNTDFGGTFFRSFNGPGNYTVMHVTATSFTLTASPFMSSDPNWRAALNGMQIVPVQPPAEEDHIFFDGFDQY